MDGALKPSATSTQYCCSVCVCVCVACTAASLAATLRLCGRTAIARVCKVLGCSADGLEMLSGLQLVRMVMKKGKLRPTTGHGEVDKLVVRKCKKAHTHEMGCHQVGV